MEIAEEDGFCRNWDLLRTKKKKEGHNPNACSPLVVGWQPQINPGETKEQLEQLRDSFLPFFSHRLNRGQVYNSVDFPCLLNQAVVICHIGVHIEDFLQENKFKKITVNIYIKKDLQLIT